MLRFGTEYVAAARSTTNAGTRSRRLNSHASCAAGHDPGYSAEIIRMAEEVSRLPT
jgi:hypothetical protein